MPDSDYQQRFGGIQRLYGETEAQWIREMDICVVGLGGVGSWVVEALARSGIGAITLIDFDKISITNMNRQIQALDENIGRKKGEVLAERVQQIHPDCQITIVDDFITDKNLFDYLPIENKDDIFDYVVDAIDSISFKAALIYYCKRNKIPIITTGAAGGLTDPTQIQIRDLTRTTNDPLAAKVRSCLRAKHGYSRTPGRYFGIECVFSKQQQVYPKEDGSVDYQKPGIHGVHLDCSMGYGSASFVTATIGFAAASRVIDKALKRRHRLLT